MPQPPTDLVTQVRKILRANLGHRVRIAWLHRTLRCAMADLIAAFDLIPGLVRIRGANASVMLG